MSVHRSVALLLLGFALSTGTAMAQPIGTFRWQIQPYCNVITINVTQQGTIYQLDGTDDNCGGGNQPGSAVGIAYLTPLGLVGFGITSVLPNGIPVHTEATVSIATLNGTWRDSAGNNGNFIFTPGAGIGGAQRPIPSGGIAPASITNIQIANNAVTGANIVNGSITSVDILDGPRAAFAGGNQLDIALTAVDTVVRSVTLVAPAQGRVIVNASGYFHFTNNATSDGGRCEITTATVISFNQLILTSEVAVDSLDFAAFAGTRGFDVTAGSHTFNLVCDASAGTAAVADTNMTALFVAMP